MNVKECYAAMGADYEDVLSRLRKDDRVEKFLRKVPGDPSFQSLCTAVEQGNLEEAFRAAHTLKGVCQNLSLTRLYEAASAITELLRGKDTLDPRVPQAMDQLRQIYDQNMECIGRL